MRVGPYLLHGTIASGGFGRIDYATIEAVGGFSRVVAVKRVRGDRIGEGDALAMLADEARLVSRIQHPNVVQVIDVLGDETELFVVMEYVEGETLSYLTRAASRRGEPIPLPVAAAIVGQTLLGLHAAHEAADGDGTPLEIVHRDVSPQNVMVSTHGLAQVLDFGAAKAARQRHRTATGEVRGKVAYMAPEQLSGDGVTRQTDVYAAGVVLWETVTGRSLFDAADAQALVDLVLIGAIDPPSKHRPEISDALESVVMRALAADPCERFASALDMAQALTASVAAASSTEVGAWVTALAAVSLAQKRRDVEQLQTTVERLSESTLVDRSATGGSLPFSPRRHRLFACGLLVLVIGGVVWATRVGSTSRDRSAAPVPIDPGTTPRGGPMPRRRPVSRSPLHSRRHRRKRHRHCPRRRRRPHRRSAHSPRGRTSTIK